MMGLFPLLMLTAVGVVLLLAVSLEKVLSGILAHKVINWKHSILATLALLVLWFLSCIIIVLSAGLSHSERIKDLTAARCFLSFLIIVGLPGVSLLLLSRRSTLKGSGVPRLKRVSIPIFCILISLIFFFSAKSSMWPPLAVATKYDFSRTSQSLIKMGANINEEDAYGFAPLWYAARNGDLATTELLIEKGADLQKWGAASLCQACINGHAEVAAYLVDHGVDVNALVYQYPQWTVLMATTNAGQLDVVKMLVRKGASLDIRDKDGRSALMIAQGRMQLQIAEFLKALKAEDIKRKSGR